MSDSVSVPSELPAAEALRLADRAGAAARQPAPTPRWYGPALALGFACYGFGVGQAIEVHWIWLVGVLGGTFAAASGLLARVAVRSGGVVPKGVPAGIGGPVLLAVLGVCAAAGAALGAAWLAGGGPRWMGAAAGVAAGAAFWAASGWLNRRVRRRSAAR